MLRVLSLSYRQGLASKKQIQINNVKSSLIQLFKEKTARKSLAYNFKIFPTFFEENYIDAFINSPSISEALQYIHNKKPDKAETRRLQRLFFKDKEAQKMVHLNPLTAIYLEAYLHWLVNECQQFNLDMNDFMMEYINLDRPDKWFQQEEKRQPRTFIYHHGPTNSGKSTSAIQDLKGLAPEEKGIYMAPLRLLAWEYQQKLQNCSLVTGQQKEYKNSNLISCTIEAAPLKEEYQVAVIDEIQMIGDSERGWAWTKAILGVRAKRVHLCGDQRALGIISKILQVTGDVLEQRRYSRLSKLILIHKIFNLENIAPGDCIINFSMNKLIKHRNDMNKMLNHKKTLELDTIKDNVTQEEEVTDKAPVKQNHTAIIYGRLPPECRKQQAQNFNMNRLPYLVATNAIGMGLNLNIKKIVLMDHEKQSSNGQPQQLQEHEIQQIAGRAGRGQETGYVQCANTKILAKVKKALLNVNQTYGIQLQNQQDQNSQNTSQITLEEKYPIKIKTDSMYNVFLKREMRQKQYSIKQACFYFSNQFIVDASLILEQFTNRKFHLLQTLDFLKAYCQLNKELYFLQGNKQISYIMYLLENHQFHVEDIIFFYNGLTLYRTGNSEKKKVVQRMEKTYRLFIQNFSQLRKVPLPKFLVQEHQDNYSNYLYMDQISQLQNYYNLLQSYVWLWNKYEFAFYQVQLANDIKKGLSAKINEVLLNNLFIKDQKKQEAQESDGRIDPELPVFNSFQHAKIIKKKGPMNQKTKKVRPNFLKRLENSKKDSEDKQNQESSLKKVTPKFLQKIKGKQSS